MNQSEVAKVLEDDVVSELKEWLMQAEVLLVKATPEEGKYIVEATQIVKNALTFFLTISDFGLRSILLLTAQLVISGPEFTKKSSMLISALASGSAITIGEPIKDKRILDRASGRA